MSAPDFEKRAQEIYSFWRLGGKGDMVELAVKALRECFAVGLERGAQICEARTEFLSKDPNYHGGYENLMRGILEGRAADIRSEAAAVKGEKL